MGFALSFALETDIQDINFVVVELNLSSEGRDLLGVVDSLYKFDYVKVSGAYEEHSDCNEYFILR